VAAAELEAIADDYGTKALEARASVARSQAALAAGDPVRALAAATQARMLWQELGMPYESARAQVLAAEARAAVGHERSAEVDLRAALSSFTRLGAGLDRRHVAVRLGDASPSGDETLGLSPRELEVLSLVAAGLTDAEIAERLFLSPHTIHRHLSNIRRKMNQPSRSGAVAQAARTGLI
jgi:DNA-binding NarL/FixJ family response regulator